MARSWLIRGVMLLLVWAGLALVPAPAQAQETVPPESVGMDSARLARLPAYVEKAIEEGDFPGAVLYVARHGRVVIHRAFGVRDPDTGDPMRLDALFRIYSMTKPLTATAALRMAERGEIALLQELSLYLPAFGAMTVMDERHADRVLEPLLARPVTIPILLYDLIRHTAGFGDESFYPGFVGGQFRAAGIGGQTMTLAQALDKVAAIPLIFEPGSHFSYAETSFTALGRVLEIASGKTIDQVMADEVLAPLGMSDTAFWYGQEAALRLAQPFPGKEARVTIDPIGPRPYLSPANGLVSTAADYARWVQMLLDDGRAADGSVLLSPVTVDNMLSDSLQGIAPGYFFPFDSKLQGFSWGLGMGVRLPGVATPSLAGPATFAWVGADGTIFLGDRDLDTVVVLMVQGDDFGMQHFAALSALISQAVITR